jgi:hypothetical protein
MLCREAQMFCREVRMLCREARILHRELQMFCRETRMLHREARMTILQRSKRRCAAATMESRVEFCQGMAVYLVYMRRLV